MTIIEEYTTFFEEEILQARTVLSEKIEALKREEIQRIAKREVKKIVVALNRDLPERIRGLIETKLIEQKVISQVLQKKIVDLQLEDKLEKELNDLVNQLSIGVENDNAK